MRLLQAGGGLLLLTFAALSASLSLAACGGGADGTGASASTGGSGGSTTSLCGVASSATSAVVTSVSASSGVGGAGGTGGAVPYPAPHPAPPQVRDYGGPVLASPRVVPVFFAGEDPSVVAGITDFLAKVGPSKYWAAATTEYGVGALTATAPVQLAESAPATIDDSAIQLWLAAKLDGDDPAFPAADKNTIYVLHYPGGTTVTETFGGTVELGCQFFGGYHGDITLDPAHESLFVSYAVMPRCDSFDGYGGLDALTGPESHELVEAATDPYPDVDPAYATADNAHLYWQAYLVGTEVGDMCAQTLTSFTDATDVPYLVQRTWSNAAALAGHDPCVPAPAGEVYFNAVPVLTQSEGVTLDGFKFTTKAVKIPVGGTRTIDVDLYSDGPTAGPWSVTAQEVGDGNDFDLQLTLDNCGGQNGDVLHLTITVNQASAQGWESFSLVSSDGIQENLWLGIVTQ